MNKIAKSAVIGNNVTIMDGVIIEDDAVIGDNCVLDYGCIIRKGVILKESVILHPYVIIYSNTIVKENTEVFEFCVIGKPPLAPGCTTRELKRDYGILIIGENNVLCPHVTIYTGTEVGNNCLFGDGSSVREECTIGAFSMIGRNVTVSYNTKIGSHTKIMDCTHITGNVIIGDHVFISTQVATTNDNSMGREEYSESRICGPIIEDNATIGATANLLPSVRIGKNAIVAASAVVTKDVPDNKIVMGIPARITGDVEII